MPDPLDDAALAKMAEAIFGHGPVEVVECDSKPGRPLRRFQSADELLDHARSLRPRGSLHVAVRYPEMGGESTHRRVDLCSYEFDHRYTVEGWGLILLYAPLEASPIPCRVVANSRQRAEKWALYEPSPPGPEQWHWPAVARHLRRLRRVLKAAVSEQASRRAIGFS